jgi:alpha-beta hydrolase superfamily lysophospholipase
VASASARRAASSSSPDVASGSVGNVASGVSRTSNRSGAVPAGVTTKDVMFFSEAVQCHATLFLPKGFTADGKSAAVVLAPAPGETAASIERFAAQLAAHGVVAMTFDYRGWGKSGGFLYLAEPIRWDDRLRFSQHTAKVRIRRNRSIPDAQIQDIRNAAWFLQGEPGIDRNRLGLWGVDASGGHVLAASAVDVRVKAAVAQTPVIPGHDAPRRAITPSKAAQSEMIRLARTGQAPATMAAAAVMNERERTLAYGEYRPFWLLDQIPASTAVLFITAGKDAAVNNDANAVAASKVVRGPNGVTVIPGAGHSLATAAAFDAAVDAAAAWFQKYLQ